MGLFDSASRTATRDHGDLYRERADRLAADARMLLCGGRNDEAEDRVRQLIELQGRVVGDRHPDYASGLAMLAQVLIAKDELTDAETLLQRVLNIRKKALGEKHPDYADTLYDLGRLLMRWEDLQGAEPLLRKTIEIRRLTVGEKHPNYAAGLVALADLLSQREETDEAESHLRDALTIQRNSEGDTHPDYAETLLVLAGVLGQQSKFEEAENLLIKAVEILQVAFGDPHPRHMSALSALADHYQRTGRLGEAEPLWRLLFDMKKQSPDDLGAECATIQRQIAQILQHRGDFAEAANLYRNAAGTLKTTVGERHPEYATTLNSLAVVLQRTGDLSGAEPLLRQIVAIRKDVLGPRHPDYGTSLLNLAHLVQKRGDPAWAKMLLREAVEVRRAVLGERHPDYAQAIASLADVMIHQGELSNAEGLLQEALEIREEFFGREHPSVANSLGTLASLLRKQHDYTSAEQLLREALEIREKLFGTIHPDVATNLGNLAWLLQKRGDLFGAEQLLRQSLEIRRHLLGEQHPEYKQNLERYQTLYDDIQRSHGPPTAEADPRCTSAINPALVHEPDPPDFRESRAEIFPDAESPPDRGLPVHDSATPEEEVPPLATPEASTMPTVPKFLPSGGNFDFGGEIVASMESTMIPTPKMPVEPPHGAFDDFDDDMALVAHAEALSRDLLPDESHLPVGSESALDALAADMAVEEHLPSEHYVHPENPDDESFTTSEHVMDELTETQGDHEADGASHPQAEPDDLPSCVGRASDITPVETVVAPPSAWEPTDPVAQREDEGDETSIGTRESTAEVDFVEAFSPTENVVETGCEDGDPGENPEPADAISRKESTSVDTEPKVCGRSSPAAEFMWPGEPGRPEAIPARSPSMSQSSSHLSQELAALSDRFSDIGERLLAAARQFHSPGTPPPEDLIEAIGGSRRDFFSLRDRVVELAGTLHLDCSQGHELVNLQTLNNLLDQVAEAEIRKSRSEDARRRAVSVLGRVTSIVHTSAGDFEPLRAAHEQAHSLRSGIAEGMWSTLHPETERLASGDHHFADLLSLIEDHDELTDEQWAALHESVSQKFGKALAAAAARSKLVVNTPSGEDHHGDNGLNGQAVPSTPSHEQVR